MADLKKCITQIENITNYKIKSKNYLQNGKSGFIWTGECASVCLNDINLLKARDVRRGTNLSLYSIIDQMNIFKEAVKLRNNLENALEAWVRAEDVYDMNRTKRAADPEFPAYLVETSLNEYNRQGKIVDTVYREVQNKLKEIVRLSVSSPERNSGEVIEYYIEINRVNNEVIGELKKVISELDLVKTELNSINVEDTVRVTGSYPVSEPNVMYTPAVNMVLSSSANKKAKTVYFSSAKERLISNIDKLQIKIQNIIGKIESHIDKITAYENGSTAENAEKENVYVEKTYASSETITEQKEETASVTPASETQKYVVKPGDSLAKIAAKHGISWQELYNANKEAIGNNPGLINVGLSLVIPGAAAVNSVAENTGNTTSKSNTSNTPTSTPKPSSGSTPSGDDLVGSSVNKNNNNSSQTPKIFEDVENKNVYSPTQVYCSKEEFLRVGDNLWGRNSNTVLNGSTHSYKEGFNDNIKPYLGVIYDEAVKRDLNPNFVLAIALHESGYGSSNYAYNKNNIFGYKGDGGFKTFSSIEEGIITACDRLVSKDASVVYNLSSVDSVAKNYCPGTDQSWAKNIKGFMEKIDDAIY